MNVPLRPMIIYIAKDHDFQGAFFRKWTFRVALFMNHSNMFYYNQVIRDCTERPLLESESPLE